jgi:hypothetical protein
VAVCLYIPCALSAQHHLPARVGWGLAYVHLQMKTQTEEVKDLQPPCGLKACVVSLVYLLLRSFLPSAHRTRACVRGFEKGGPGGCGWRGQH